MAVYSWQNHRTIAGGCSSKPLRILSGSPRAHVPSCGLPACRSSKAIDPWADELCFHGKKHNFQLLLNDVFEVIPFVLGVWWVFGGLGVSGNYPLLMIVFFKQGTVSINLGLAMFPSCCYLIVIACQMGGIGFKLDGVDLRSRRPPDFSAHWDAGGSAGFYRLLLLKYGISQIGMGKKLWRPWSPQIGYFDSY